MTVDKLFEQLVFSIYRLTSHALMNWADDPALLAIIFC